MSNVIPFAESRAKLSERLLDLQGRLYDAKSQLRGAESLAHNLDEVGNIDVVSIVRMATDQVEEIANELGNIQTCGS